MGTPPIALNASGVTYGGDITTRGRFIAILPSQREYLMALTITSNPLSPFFHNGQTVSLAGQPVATAGEIQEDTCTTSYWRGGKKHLTLNSNARSRCKGCAFCGTYELTDDDAVLTNLVALEKKAQTLADELETDLSGLKSIGVVTGCFSSEEKVVDHLLMVREAFSKLGFNGELRYIGSQVRSDEALRKLIDSGPTALYLTVEHFARRDQLMKRTKASLDLEGGRNLLGRAKGLGLDTSFLYIVGLDSLETLADELPKYQGMLTRSPLVQTYQLYKPEQIILRDPQAAKLDYYLHSRQMFEAVFPELIPDPTSNFRSLWYTKYANVPIANADI